MSSNLQPFDTYVLPISGTDFVRYIAALSFLAEFRKQQQLEPLKPRVIFGASGGALVAYLAMMSSFGENIQDWTFSSDMFVNRPTPFTPRLLTFTLRGYFYHRTNLTDYIAAGFVPHMLQDVEIVTGYYEMIDQGSSRSMVTIVSNFPKEHSVLRNRENDMMSNVQVVHPPEMPRTSPATEDLWRSERRAYLDSLMLFVSNALSRTTNIPYIMEPLGESGCIDYGVVSPSPRVTTRADISRSIYFVPVDIDRVGVVTGSDMLFHHYIMNDVLSLRSQFRTQKRFDNGSTSQMLTDAFRWISDLASSRYCLVIYSTAVINISFTDFDNKTIADAITMCKSKLRFLVLHD